MKSLTLFAIYIASFITIFLMLSFVGWVFNGNYIEIVRNNTWQIIYTVFIGWWIAIFPAREYSIKHEKEFDKIF